ncbi:TolB-like translocation protein [Streptacidiphilus rugosus]|uniref:PD40 domain-containing protein n=1 Tax=Streptacidiphilus rugosus TaxID=405783 RepID=UPI00056BC0B4|nr:PD40 domain-containing protein [Streptacidiphilus rugosus]
MRARRNVAAIALVAAVTGCGLLTACGPDKGHAVGASPAASSSFSGKGASAGAGGASPQPSASANGSGSGSGGTTAAPVALNGTGGTLLTISNGTSHVLMNGASVDFGVTVRDLNWSPDGRKAIFIDGNGNLDSANPDGSGRITVARNPGNQTWSHPTWQAPADRAEFREVNIAKIFFVANGGGVTQLMSVPAERADGAPALLSLGNYAGANVAQLPQTGNIWINGGGGNGTTVYANTGTGEVYLRDDYIRQQGAANTNGSEPALIPGTGGEPGGIVFVRSVAGHDHVFVEEFTNSGRPVRDLTPNATTDYTEPAVSPDGRTVALRTPNGVAVVPLNGSAAPRPVSTTPGLPAYR